MTGYLLDTCVLSDLQKSANAGLDSWMQSQDERQLYLSPITVGEIQYGIERLPRGKKRTMLSEWLQTEVLGAFEGRLLSLDVELFLGWGTLRAVAARRGNNPDMIDVLIAATAMHYDLTLVTRNDRHFAGIGISYVNPWS